MTRQFSTLAARPQPLACHYDELSADIPLNQVMKATIAKLTSLATTPDNQRSLRELSFAYADIQAVQPAAVRWDLITLDRTDRRWRDLVALARLLLGERYQTTTMGPSDGHARFFEMNMLFESYVARLLKRALAGTSLRVVTQGGHQDCLYEEGVGRFWTRPDIVIHDAGGPAMIVDTKWKRMTPRIDDPKQGGSQANVYQLMAYAQIYRCNRVMLLYPHHHGLPATPVCKSYDIASRDGPGRLIVSTVDVSRSHSEVSSALGSLVLRALAEDSAIDI